VLLAETVSLGGLSHSVGVYVRLKHLKIKKYIVYYLRIGPLHPNLVFQIVILLLSVLKR
jgi:hypothetical protein